VSVVVGAVVTAAVCRWGLCLCCPGVGRCLSGVYNPRRVSYVSIGGALGSVTKLAKASRSVVRFKCPYCPVEATMAMARMLHLS